MANLNVGPAAFRVEGVTEVLAALSVADAEIIARAEVVLRAGADVVAAVAKGNVSEHNWSGRLANKIQVKVTAPLELSVGTRSPEGRPLEFGWTSSIGKQPPSGPRSRLVKWLTAEGVAEPRRVAFLVARKIGTSGYGFPPTHWLGRAAETSGPEVVAAMHREMRV